MLNGIYEYYCNFSIKIKNKAIQLRIRSWNSLKNLTWTYNICNNVKISYETIKQLNEDLKPSGYLAYDV